MARLQIDVESVPGLSLDVVAPEYGHDEEVCGVDRQEFLTGQHRVLWFLHGFGGTSADALRFSKIEIYARERGLFVVCPSAESGFYTDSPDGDLWETRIVEDLWRYVHTVFPRMSERPEDNTIAGVSMGGYGAARYALRHPDRFGCFASLSGGLNMPQRYAEGENVNGQFEHYFGPRDAIAGGEHDLFAAATAVAHSGGPRPRAHLACGTRDWEYVPNRAFYGHLRDLGYEVTWDEADFGHEWRFWDQQLDRLTALVAPDYLVTHRRA